MLRLDIKSSSGFSSVCMYRKIRCVNLQAHHPRCVISNQGGGYVKTQLSCILLYYADDDMFRPLWPIFRSQKCIQRKTIQSMIIVGRVAQSVQRLTTGLTVRDRISVGRDFPPVQIGPGVDPASCKLGTGSFPGVKCGPGVLLTTHPFQNRGHGRVELHFYPPSGPYRACNGIKKKFDHCTGAYSKLLMRSRCRLDYTY